MRLTYFIGLLCVSLFHAAPASACLQGSSAAEIRKETINQAKEARLLVQIMESPVPDNSSSDATTPPQESWKKVEAEGVANILKGDYLRAVELLQKAEATAPGQYSVAANLGTAYELAGQNPNALRWITESLRRNPDAHDKTEWIHQLILQAKVRKDQQESANFISLIPLPEEFTEHTLVTIPGAKHPVAEVKRAIHYQLRERMRFVKPTDIYVADLLYTLSLIDARLHGYDSAYTYAKLAETYGHPDQARVRSDRRTYFWPMIFFRTTDFIKLPLEIIAGLALIYLALNVIVRFARMIGVYRFSRRSTSV